MRRITLTASVLLLAAAILLWVVRPAAADTIHLDNGRVIRTVDARVEDGHVVFWQFGSRQSIPLSVVEKVVEDDSREPGAPASRSVPGTDIPEHARSGPAAAGGGNPGATNSGPTGDGTPRAAITGPGRGAGDVDAAAAGLSGLDLATLAGLAGLAGDGASGGSVDPTLALGALRSLGGGILPLADRLGALGDGGAGATGELGALLRIVPALRELGEVMTAESPTPGRASTAASDLLRSLSELGVTEEMIRAEAARLGISLEGFTFPRR